MQPIHGAIAYRRYVARVKAGEPANPARLYIQTGITEWSFLFVLFVSWYWLNRPLADLGFVQPGGTWFLVCAGVVVIAAISFALSIPRIARMSQDEKDRQIGALGDLVHFLPGTRREFRYFTALSITAGVVEEIVYRGFVLWYLANFMPLWAALLLSSVFFGLGHSYQGKSGALRTGLVGLVFAILYVMSGSIWLPIIGHAVFDILQGKMIHEMLLKD